MLFDNSEHVTGPHGPRGAIALGQRLRPTRPRGARVPRPPSGGGGATEGPQKKKPMEETAPGARETERRRERSSRRANPFRPSGRRKRERLRRQSRTRKVRRGRRRRRRRRPRGTGILEGRSEPHERSSGRPEGGWRAEETVEVVQTARTERSGQATAAVCDGASRRGRGRRHPHALKGHGTSREELCDARPPPFGRVHAEPGRTGRPSGRPTGPSGDGWLRVRCL